VEAILATLHKNVALAKQVLREVVPALVPDRRCACNEALRNAIVTPPDRMPASAKRRLKLLIAPYVSSGKGKR
jgi:5'-methylthioadenosine phosphorylase